MKNSIVRLSVLALAATGFASSTVITKANSASTKISPIVIAGTPTPMCTPGHGVCGMD